MKNTGYKAYGKPLFVGDMLAQYDGHGGYYEIVEKDGEYWVVDCSEKVWGHDFPEEEKMPPFKLEHNLGIHWTKVDKNNPTKTPPMEIKCEYCDQVVGEFDVDTEEFTWHKNCAYHEEPEEEYLYAFCHECYKDKGKKEKPAPKLTEVEEYFWQQYEKASFRVVPGHWPDFQTKEEVNEWIESIEALMSAISNKAFQS